MQHPLERFFIPEKVEILQTQFFLTLKSSDLVSFVDFDIEGVIGEEELFLDDPAYQKRNHEVKDYLLEVYNEKHPIQAQ